MVIYMIKVEIHFHLNLERSIQEIQIKNTLQLLLAMFIGEKTDEAAV